MITVKNYHHFYQWNVFPKLRSYGHSSSLLLIERVSVEFEETILFATWPASVLYVATKFGGGRRGFLRTMQ